jgi:hypothetical protein
MLNLLLPVLAGAVAGALGGGLMAWWLTRRLEPPEEPELPTPPDPWPPFDIDQAAASWAIAIGRPEAKGLLADKLRLLYGLGRIRQRRQPGRWPR